MHAADPARCKYRDADQMRQSHSCGHGCCAVALVGDCNGKITSRQLKDAVTPGEALHGGIVQSDRRHATEHADRGGYGTGITHHCFERMRNVDILRVRQPVRDHRRLKRDHGLLARDGFLYMRRN